MSVQFYGYNFGGTGVFQFFTFMHCFQNLVSDFGDFQTLYVRRDCHRESTTCKWVWGDESRVIHCKYGSSFMGLTMQELAPGMRNVLPFLIIDAKSCIDSEPHKERSRFAMNESTCRFISSHSFACSAFSMTVCSNVWGLKISKIWNEFLKRMHKSKIIPIKLYTHLLCTTKILLPVMNVVKSY